MSDVIVYGIHAVNAVLSNPLRRVKTLFINQERQDERLSAIQAIAMQREVAIMGLSQQEMNRRFPEMVHQGVALSVSRLPDYTESHLVELLETIPDEPFILILDGITDPHNLGACLRTADAAGVHFVVIPKDKNASITPTVSKVACGAAEAIPLVRVTNLARAIKTLKNHGVWVYGAAGEATQPLFELDCKRPLAIVMGAEGSGLRHLTRELCDGLFSLPMMGTVSSLNVSVATGICLYERVRSTASRASN